MVEKVSRLYEHADNIWIETYHKRWWQWVRTGVDEVLRVGDRFDWGLVRIANELV